MNYFLEGLTLGLATGISCAVLCVPVLLGLASRSINNITPVSDLIFFLSGRLIAYIIVAIIFSALGMQLNFTGLIDFISRMFIAALLLFWGIRGLTESEKDKSNCKVKKHIKAVPFIAGILTGISPCPPFIIGITRVFTLGNIPTGIIYFIGFFFTTSLFLIPALVTGLIKHKKELKFITSFIAIIFSVVFISSGITSLLTSK